MLKDNIEWPIHRQFNSNKEWEPLYFFSECLCNSVSFDLSLGFFSSTAIRTLACGFATFIYNGGKMRLIINNILSEDDKNTLLKANNGEIVASFDLSDIAKLRESLSAYDRQFFDCLSYLIAHKRIEILVVEPNSGRGISHTKSGVFYDGENYVAFNGSCNFTKTALLDNIESVDAYCDWDGSVIVAKIENIQKEFEDKYTKADTTVKYVDPSDITVSIQNFFKEKEMSELLSQERELIEREIGDKRSSQSIRENVKRILDRAKTKLDKIIVKSEAIKNQPKFPWGSEPRDYQKLAFENWKANGQKGLFAMATGTGKTITSLNCLLEIYKRTGYYKAIILVPTITLLEQWVGECRKFNFNNIFKVYSKNSRWKSDVGNITLQEKLGGKDEKISYVIISTYASFAKDKVFSHLNELSRTRLLLIADEAHNMGSGQIKSKLNAVKYGRRIGLSATPERQYDDDGNKALLSFFGAEERYTYEYSMAEAIDNDVLCRYLYYPHIVRLTESEMEAYTELSIKIAKFATFEGEIKKGDSMLTALLLKRKRIIHKAANKKHCFKNIIKDLYEDNGTLKHTLVYVPEGNEPDEVADVFYNREDIATDIESQHLIDQYSAIVRDVHPRTTVKQFTSASGDRDRILEEFAAGRLEVLTSMKCLDEGVDVPQSKTAIFCASTGNPRQFIQRRGRILRQSKATHKHLAIIHDLVVVPEINRLTESYNLEKNMIKTELNRVRNFALLAENCNDSLSVLDDILSKYNLSLFLNINEDGE
ncbi:MAG: DEAD/DEAH box helicase family protein [Rikenellaceae bacterium]